MSDRSMRRDVVNEDLKDLLKKNNMMLNVLNAVVMI
jgi:hypothetical protein